MSSAAMPPLTGAEFEELNARYLAAFEQGQYEDALRLALEGTQRHATHFYFWMQASICALYLRRWQDAADWGERALQFPGAGYSLYDSLAHAYGELKQVDKVRAFGRQALEQRDIMYGQRVPAPDWPIPPAPAAPDAQNTGRNWVALSLFGDRSKYCETAVLNAELLPDIYPGWSCVVFVDASVPAHVIQRLHGANAFVQVVDHEVAQWPGPMWRMLAADLVGAQRVIFRDADSLISEREATAVNEWVASGRAFHIIRDSGSHTELLLAGLWGMVAGATPPMRTLLRDFLARPVQNRHFADQWFLRQVIWPYARRSLMSHDSQYGFMDARPLRVPPPHPHFHVGSPEGAALVTLRTGLPHGTTAHWTLVTGSGDASRKVCTYPVSIQHGLALLELPFYYAHQIQQGVAKIDVSADQAGDLASAASASLEQRKREFQSLFDKRDFAAALAHAQASVSMFPQTAYFLTACTLCCTRLQRWQEAVDWGMRAEPLPDIGFNLFDALSYAAWSLGRAEDVRRWGLRALSLRDEKFGRTDAAPELKPAPRPPPPAPERAHRNVLAFSLFGADPKYVEPAVENAVAVHTIYPGWRARFYVDESVPKEALARLSQSGAEVIHVDSSLRSWPGAMWRLLAADDEGVDRVLFRDADAVVSEREARAVCDWVNDGACFHTMRDAGTHTELIMAGMWGALTGVLPKLRPLIEGYLAEKTPQGFARHYADQWFLRSRVWPHVRQAVLSHDSQFGFGRHLPFSPPESSARANIGGCVGGLNCRVSVPWQDGVRVSWSARSATNLDEKCSGDYQAPVMQGQLAVSLTQKQMRAWRREELVLQLDAQGQTLVKRWSQANE